MAMLDADGVQPESFKLRQAFFYECGLSSIGIPGEMEDEGFHENQTFACETHESIQNRLR